MGVETLTVNEDEADQRLDRWLRRRFPGLTQGRLQKLLRKGEVRIDGKRIREAGQRLEAGQQVRIPPLDDARQKKAPSKPRPPQASQAEIDALMKRIIHRDDHLLVLDKPAGLAVQGGSGTQQHVDAMLDHLTFGLAERPRLVHRLDKDTSGVLVLARTLKAAKALAQAFQTRAVRKRYWAAVVGVPDPASGEVRLPLSKRASPGGEKVWVDEFEGKHAHSRYRVLDKAGKRAAWVEMEPLTGRTHQLRVHMATLGTPVLGDGKYGGKDAFLPGAEIPHQLHLHARAVQLPHPGGGPLTVVAPMPDHMRETWAYLGFNADDAPEPFAPDDDWD